MKLTHLKSTVALSVAAALAGCGSSNSTTGSSATNPMQLTVPGVSAAVSYSFDLGAIDPATGVYYVTDRTNKSIDVMSGNTVTQFKQAFAGCNSGGTTGGSTGVFVPMPGCLNIAITANKTYVVNNDFSGPDGLDIVGPNLFVGDVNALWVINKTTGAKVAKIAIPNSGPAQDPTPGAAVTQGFRSDEGCYDSKNHLYATALTGDPHFPFYTILDTTAHDLDATGATLPVVIGQLLMNDGSGGAAAGLEACFFDTRNATTGSTTETAGFMWLNNDGTTNGAGSTNRPNGEADGVPIGDLIALRTAFNALPVPRKPFKIVFRGPLTATPDFGVSTPNTAPTCALGGGGACGSVLPKDFGLPALCDPTGIAAGPAAGNEVGAMCRPGTFNQRMDFVIFNTGGPTTTAPSSVQVVAGAGGGDQVAFDAASNKYYLANSRATPSGKSCFDGSTQVCNLTPKLGVVDGTTHAFVAQVDTGNNSHSVAAGNGMVVLPFTNTSAAGGGANFPGGGIAVYPTF